jgi:hypothetical protein
MNYSIFRSSRELLQAGIVGQFPSQISEITASRAELRHAVNETLTRPWIRHFFITEALQAQSVTTEEKLARAKNLVEIFRTTIPLPENNFADSPLSSWRMFLEASFRDAELSWHRGFRKLLVKERLFNAIEHLEIDVPESNPQRAMQFRDQRGSLRRLPRIPVKLLITLPGNEREAVCRTLKAAMGNNPHNTDLAMLAYALFVAWDRGIDFLQIVQEFDRDELKEWYYWVNNDMTSLGVLKKTARDFSGYFYICDRADYTPGEYREIADWYLRESEFKYAYHFYQKAKEFETAIDLLQNISHREFAELSNMRRISAGDRPVDYTADAGRMELIYGEELETLRGFARIREAGAYRQVAVRARQHFDRETIETKYAFGELTEDEYQRLINQLTERQH